jgi:thiamine-phosphate pyrophosphorylase
MTSERRVRGLYAIADTRYLTPARIVAAVTEAIDGGATMIQFRDKTSDTEPRRRMAGALAELCRQRGVLFLINDDVALAQAVGADGVHLGREDTALADARRALGPNAVIGVSCYDELDRAREATRAGADYVAFGAFFPSPTKPQAVRASLELLRAARAELRVPIVAIGGITPENGAALVAAGAGALAVITGVFADDDIRAAARRYARLFEPH